MNTFYHIQDKQKGDLQLRVKTMIIVTLLSVLLFAIGSVNAEIGVTESEIKIGVWTPLSGPLSLLGTSASDGVKVWADEVNSTGGINGRKIKVIIYDDGASPQEGQAAVRRLVEQDKVFMLIAGSSSGSTLPMRKYITKKKVPFVSSISSNNNLMNPFSRYIFRIYANETDQAKAIINWMIAKENIKRPAIIYNSNDYGVGGFEEAKAQLKQKYGMQLVAAERYNTGDQDFSAQLLRIKVAKPDGVLVYAYAPSAGIIARQAKELGLEAKMFGGGATATNLFQKAAGDASVGFTACFVLPNMADSEDVPAVTGYRERLRQLIAANGDFPSGRPSEYDLAAFGAGKVCEEALKRTGKALTREGFIDALESLTAFDTGVTFPVTYSAKSHEGTTKMQIIAVGPDLKWHLK